MASTKHNSSLLVAFLSFLVLALIILMPFHAFFTTWIGSHTGVLLAVRAWKEVLVVVGVIAGSILLIRDADLRKSFFNDRLNQTITVFGFGLTLVSLLLVKDHVALLAGLAIQLRLFLIFLLAQIVAFYKPPSRKMIWLIVMIPAVVVSCFALLQIFVLPPEFLSRFGYQKGVTIPPYFTIDEQFNRLRIFSTLRGPNPLGVYLILPILFLIHWVHEQAKQQKKQSILFGATVITLALLVLYCSHSRSAWLGLVAAVFVFIFLRVDKKVRYLLSAFVVMLGLTLGGLVYLQRNTQFVQDVILHDDPVEGGEVSSNKGHLDSAIEGLADIQDRPVVGCGAGCAGPASVHNDSGGRIAENYFIQTAQEFGLVGLSLLIVIFVLISRRLLESDHEFAPPLFAIFVGVCTASMLSHAWADDTIAYIWWGLAGLVVYTNSSSKEPKQTE